MGKGSAILILIFVHVSNSCKISIQQKILNIKDTFKEMEDNPNFGLQKGTGSSRFLIQLSIPPGPKRYYGTLNDRETAQKAVSMILQEYWQSLERVVNGKSNFPATFHQLAMKFVYWEKSTSKNLQCSESEGSTTEISY